MKNSKLYGMTLYSYPGDNFRNQNDHEDHNNNGNDIAYDKQ